MMSRSIETGTFFTVFSPMTRCGTTFEQTIAELTLVRVDTDTTLVDRIGALMDAVVDDAARLGAVMQALQSQSARQLSRSNLGRWSPIRCAPSSTSCSTLATVRRCCPTAATCARRFDD
jgi:hypothetical protein